MSKLTYSDKTRKLTVRTTERVWKELDEESRAAARSKQEIVERALIQYIGRAKARRKNATK